MICYKDQSYCNSDCTNHLCFRYFSDEVKKAAETWWGGPDAPIAFSDFSNTCEDYKK